MKSEVKMVKENIKVTMITAVSKALDYKKKKPNAENEEIFQHIMKEIKATEKAKTAAIAAVNKALQYGEIEKKSEKEILQHVMKELDKIIKSIE